MESSSFACATGENMLVADSKPLTKLTRRQNNLQQIKICNRVGQIPLKMDLASDTMWTLNGITLYPICIFGWWSSSLFCIKANFA